MNTRVLPLPVSRERSPVSSPVLARVREERLARLVARGEDRAFNALYERYKQPLYRYVRTIVGSDADAQDALQAAFLSALVALRRGRRDAPLRPWLFRIAHNEAVSLLRRRRPTVELSALSPVALPSAAHVAQERERLQVLVQDLAQLGDRQRGALVMRELSGLSHEEIAAALETSTSAAKQAIFEARRALADFAEGRAMACEQIQLAISHEDRRTLRARRVQAHLRSCRACSAFAAAIPARRADLRALAPPLAPLAAAELLRGVLRPGAAHGGGGASAALAGAGGKAGLAALGAKALVGTVVIAAATAGATHVLRGSGVQPATHARATHSGLAPAHHARSRRAAAARLARARRSRAVAAAAGSAAADDSALPATRTDARGAAPTAGEGRRADRAGAPSSLPHEGAGLTPHGRPTPPHRESAGRAPQGAHPRTPAHPQATTQATPGEGVGTHAVEAPAGTARESAGGANVRTPARIPSAAR
jgi:RNA polymerase sigma factor (sigma-70 family)